MVQSLLEMETGDVVGVVGDQLVAQEGGELFVDRTADVITLDEVERIVI
jgi:hypothetical protein